MKNHKMVDGKLIQTNKKYSHLKLKQKEKIHQWMYESYRDIYLKTGKYPEGKECDTILEPLEIRFSVCKVENYKMVDIDRDFCFIGKTDEERSLVCPVDMVPDNTTVRDDGWKCFRICGVLDFSLIGILARISKILAYNQIGIFAISTYNTDYILTKEKDFKKALQVLKSSGYQIKE